jgi:succinate dehydrogenase / fumarate reductase membrane anchor subunit
MNTVRSTVSARAGFTEWLLQRVSAIYLAGFCVYLAVRFLASPITSHKDWLAWFEHGGVRMAWALAIASLLIHAWTGMRSVYLDYLKPLWVRFTVQVLTALALSAMALWSAQILLRVGS